MELGKKVDDPQAILFWLKKIIEVYLRTWKTVNIKLNVNLGLLLNKLLVLQYM